MTAAQHAERTPWQEIGRERMLALLRREISDARVIEAMAVVPRERFVPDAYAGAAYDDRALPIEGGQTISQPLMVALMLDALQLHPTDRALEVGTGSGYAAVVMSMLARQVTTVERVPELAAAARDRLASLGYGNVAVRRAGDALGWPDDAPYGAILVSAGAPHVPRKLLEQLAPGGRLVLPVGDRSAQRLVRATRTEHGVTLERLGACAFVPLIGDGAWDDDQVNGASGRPSVR